jgi:acetylornithine deacetylase
MVSMKLDVVRLTQELIAYHSESLSSNVAVTLHIANLLERLGFRIEELPYADDAGVDKLCIVAKLGEGTGGLSLMSHDDVVPARREDGWRADPFKGRVRKGRLYGRGACDMKGPLAASVCAAARFKARALKTPLFLIVTADEETQARGARELVKRSRLFDEAMNGYGIICEPTRLRVVHAHKGALAITVTARGRAAHTSTLRGINANIKMIPFLNEMKKIYDLTLSAKRYRNDEFDPPHSEWSIGISDYNTATNMCPVRSVCTINYRPMPGVDVKPLIKRARESARRHGLECLVFSVGDPLYTPLDAPLVRTALRLSGRRKATTVPYGTDGMVFVKKMKQMVVLGPGDIAQAHTADEWIDIEKLRQGVDLYTRFIDHVCVQGLP